MWALASNPSITYTVFGVANMYPEWAVYWVMKCDQTGALDLLLNAATHDGTLIKVEGK